MKDRARTEPARFELFAFWRTSATYRVRVALNLKGLAADERVIDLDAGEQRSPDFLAVNPLGAIPALVDRAAPQAAPLTQSMAILEFLEEVHPDPALLPKDPHARARVRGLASMLVADTHPLITQRVISYLAETGPFDAAAALAWRRHWFTTGLQAVEQRLASETETGTFCHGEAISFADICLASIKVNLPIFKIEVPGTPVVDRIFAACAAHPAFAEAAPQRQVGAPAS